MDIALALMTTIRADRVGIEALIRATEIVGGQAELARISGLKQPSISRQMSRGKKVPAEWCLPIEQATGGKISRHDLRPDIYPPGVA